MENESKSKRGGHREGAGRKKENRDRMFVRVSPETRAKLTTMAEERGMNIGRLLDEIVEGL